MQQAIEFYRYGAPSAVLEKVEKAIPTPNDDQVLVKIVAAAVNPLDWHRYRADPFIVRFSDGFFKPKNPKLGADIAGVITAVGKNITQFKVGDEVFGEVGSGGFAEYLVVSEKHITHKPANVTFEQAAATPVAAFTAIQGLQAANLQAGQRVLVNGASGGVGMLAVQVAKAQGAHVTGVCSTRNLELVRGFGADAVVDYTKVDFTRTGKTYDVVFDAIANRSYFDLKRNLNPNGVIVVVGFTSLLGTFGNVLASKIIPPGQGRKFIGILTATPNPEDLATMRDLLAAGKINPVIDRTYPLAETAAAMDYLETKRAQGKVVIQVR